MKPRIYIDTTVISYLTARPSSNIFAMAKQLATAQWWEGSGNKFQPFISSLVILECARGDSVAAVKRIDVCNTLEICEISDAVQTLAERLIARGAIPATEPEDAAHIAAACLHEATYIATFNFAHMANPQAKFKLQLTLKEMGYTPPLIATPIELLEISHDDEN